VFDVLHINGISLRDCALVDRKSVLVELLRGQRGPVRISDHLYGGGEALFKRACRLELEGLVSKRKDAKYRSGRNADWTKRTCRQRETFVLAGIAFNRGKFDGIYLGRRENGELVYAGKVENGFNTSVEKSLRKRAEKLETNIQPLTRKIKKPKAIWLKPKLLVDVEYRALTGTGKLRHSRSKASVRIFKPLVGGLRSRAGGNAARYSAFGLQPSLGGNDHQNCRVQTRLDKCRKSGATNTPAGEKLRSEDRHGGIVHGWRRRDCTFDCSGCCRLFSRGLCDLYQKNEK
jgi:hypothetical protein